MELKAGDIAPDFTLKDSDGNDVSLKDFRGKRVVLYFYPKDNTPGCTKEACDFRDNFDRFTTHDTVIIGISADSTDSHKKFASKYELPFILLSDPEHSVIEQYDAWKLKSFMGKKYMGIERSSILIDKNGRIIKTFPKVKVNGHISDLLTNIQI